MGIKSKRNTVSAEVLKCIRSRRSVRKYTGKEVPLTLIRKVIEAGTWAPSGLNNQPWRFVVVRGQKSRDLIAALTRYAKTVRDAAALVIVFLDQKASYNEQKDTQALGACIQNMLLAAHALGVGTCWLGEILKNGPAVNSLVKVSKRLKLHAVISLGYPAERPSRARKPLDSFIVKTII